MHLAWIGVLALVVLIGGMILGATALLLVPLLGILALLALLVWAARRRAQHRPPIE
jgi:membrane protein implicated in regulation of membrane protease activity